MKLRGIFEGSFESVWSMEVPQAEWDSYLENHPDFDENDRDDITGCGNILRALVVMMKLMTP